MNAESAAKPITYRGAVYPWHCDHMGHMNVMWYVGKFDEATWNLFASIGITAAYVREQRHGMAGLQQNITYKKELHAGDVVVVRFGDSRGAGEGDPLSTRNVQRRGGRAGGRLRIDGGASGSQDAQVAAVPARDCGAGSRRSAGMIGSFSRQSTNSTLARCGMMPASWPISSRRRMAARPSSP